MAKANPNVLGRNFTGTVLILDDDPCVLEWLRQSIGRSTYTVTTCSKPSQVLDLVARQNVLAVVTDISMPEMSGIELVRLLHELEPDLPVVLVTGVPCIESATEAVEIGAFMYLFCGAIFPLTVLPDWGQAVGRAIPITYWLEITRRAMLPNSGISSISGLGDYSNIQILSFLLLSAGIFLVLSIGIFKYADYLARKKGKLDMSTSY